MHERRKQPSRSPIQARISGWRRSRILFGHSGSAITERATNTMSHLPSSIALIGEFAGGDAAAADDRQTGDFFFHRRCGVESGFLRCPCRTMDSGTGSSAVSGRAR